MTGLSDTDIRLTEDWKLTQASDGDAPVCSGLDCLYQNIALEAVTQPGDLFYDMEFGWGLYDFIQSEEDDLMRIEITQRIRNKLLKREVIRPESIGIELAWKEDTLMVSCSFQFQEEENDRELNVVVSPVGVEVVNE